MSLKKVPASFVATKFNVPVEVVVAIRSLFVWYGKAVATIKDSLKINYLNDEKINVSEQIVIVSNTEPKINFVDINFKNK